MTPERAKWYDSLPPEEKMTRIHLGYFKHSLSVQKERLADLNIEPSNQQDEIKQCQGGIRATKVSIKALRKQIAMRPTEKYEDGERYRECPRCRRYLWRISDDIYFDDPPKYCEDCGQKLRW